MRLRPFQPLFGLCSVQRVENLLSARCAHNALQVRQGGFFYAFYALELLQSAVRNFGPMPGILSSSDAVCRAERFSL